MLLSPQGFITHTCAPLTVSQLAHRMQGLASFNTKTPKEKRRGMEEPSSYAIWQRNLSELLVNPPSLPAQGSDHDGGSTHDGGAPSQHPPHVEQGSDPPGLAAVPLPRAIVLPAVPWVCSRLIVLARY